MLRKLAVFFVLAIAVISGTMLYSYHAKKEDSALEPTPKVVETRPRIAIATSTVFIEQATTSEAILKGLSGRESLGSDQGMLFVFSVSDRYRFWMPDMNFPLDMIWLDTNKKVVDVTHNAVPLVDKTKPVFYRPSVPAQYVLEVNAGFAKSHDIVPGLQAEFLSF
jgi:uncharacterized membrane protein (UPF0127 family)